jgi:4,5-dihydroxyphthalate decarboxylase
VVKAEGIQHNRLMLGHHKIFARITFNREWDVSELSFAMAASLSSSPMAGPFACCELVINPR